MRLPPNTGMKRDDYHWMEAWQEDAMLEVLVLAAAVQGSTPEGEACKRVAEALADNALECPLFAHEVVSGEVQGVKERAIILIARMRPEDGRTLIIAFGGHNGGRYFRSLGEWKGPVPTKLAVLPAGEFELLGVSGQSQPTKIRTVWDVLVSTFSDGTRWMLMSDGKTWSAMPAAARTKAGRV